MYGYAAQEPYTFDPARAKALLAEAGWRDTNGDGVADKGGEPLTLQLHFPAKHYGQAFDEMTAAVVEMLKDVGVQVTVKPLDFGTAAADRSARARCRPTAASPPAARATASTPRTRCATGRPSRS